MRATLSPSAALLGLLAAGSRAAQYILSESYNATNFFDEFDFITEADPTNGFVQYVDTVEASRDSLAGFAGGGIYLGSDGHNTAGSGGRSSTRVKSKKAFTRGLFVADIAHMPAGSGEGGSCGLWPAFWMVGPQWPSSGEIDIVEGANNQASNAFSLHTRPGCSVSNAGSAAGTHLAHSDCSGSEGCSQTSASSTGSFGPRFNAGGGGVYALEWTDDAISAWFFPRNHTMARRLADSDRAADISFLGQPLAKFGGGGCNINRNFHNNSLVFNIDYCGDWAGKTWNNDPVCRRQAPTCEEYVANHPEAFVDAYWLINSVRVFEKTGNWTGSALRARQFTG